MTTTLTEQPAFDQARPEASGSARATRRVLHLINGEHYSGAERVQDLLALRLPEEGFAVGFACIKPDRFPSQRQSQDAPLVEVPMRSRWDFSAVRRIARLVRSAGYELIHAHTPRSVLIGRLASILARVPLVYHVHSPTARDSTRPWQNRLNALGERLSLMGSPELIAVSASLGRHMRSEGFSAQRVAVVHNGVPAVGELPSRDVPSGTWTLGTVALFRPRKGIEVLIDALALLRDQRVPVCLRAVGGFETAEYEAEIKALVERHGLTDLVQWIGPVRDVPGELERMDLFILPSLFGEGLPMVVLESMAAGIPVVATEVEGVPEAVRSGLDGVLAAPGNAADLAQKIQSVIQGEADWQALRESAFARHAQRFSDRAMAAGVARVYRRVLGD